MTLGIDVLCNNIIDVCPIVPILLILLYMNNVCPIDYMMKVRLLMHVVCYTFHVYV